MEVIFAYTRADAIRAGVLVDASAFAWEHGICYPVALTRAVWEQCVTIPKSSAYQNEFGRLWDVLTMLGRAMLMHLDESEASFSVLVQNDERPARPQRLRAVCGPGDNGEPVITVMLPEED